MGKKYFKLIKHLLFCGVILFFLFSLFTNNNFLTFLKHIKNSELLNLLRVLIWPVFIGFIILCYRNFFKKLFGYMFFSLKEFGFFGTKWELEDYKKLIKKKVQKELEEKKEEEDRQKEQAELEKERKKLKNASIDKTELAKIAARAFGQNTKLLEKKEQLEKENRELREQGNKDAYVAKRMLDLIGSDIIYKHKKGEITAANQQLQEVIKIIGEGDKEWEKEKNSTDASGFAK